MDWKNFVDQRGYCFGSGRQVLNGNPKVKRIIKSERGVVNA
jgi:hypothetical protein